MRRRFVTSTCALMVAVAVSAVSGQNPPAQQPPPGQPPAQPPTQAAPPAPSAPKLAFTSPAGLLLVQIKPDQTTAFEELVTRLKAGVAKTEDATLKQQMSSWKVYKASEPMGPEKNALYVVVADPATANAEYDFFALLQKVMTPEELRAPETAEMFKKFAGAFAAGYNKVSLTPVGGQ